ncbi:uncharacterized protein YALI1_D26988g [Yarrowia lipolytica]|uniref:Uncharacterized protein n=1 Tax=Yarrowia lipolytica TaxID=4952 RepID=A0A1D8NFJ8_YARLL|nr:hypothetical protein YALI1_D26988g [Yarrowia lipolytica]
MVVMFGLVDWRLVCADRVIFGRFGVGVNCIWRCWYQTSAFLCAHFLLIEADSKILAHSLGVELFTIASYHQSSNCMAENRVSRLKTALGLNVVPAVHGERLMH